MEKNKTKIFKGLTDVWLVQEVPISPIGHKVVTTSKRAPMIAMIQ